MKKRTIFYFDGFNLYHGMLKDTPQRWLDLWKTEEKRSDVNLATEMMADVYRDAADVFVLVSGDADLAAPLCFIRHVAKKQTLVFNPHDMICEELRKYTSLFKIIPRDLPRRCELPEEVIAPSRIIRRPPEWK